MAPTAPWWRRLPGRRAPRDTPPPGGVGGSGPGPDAPHGVRPPRTPEERRFSQVYAEDRVGPMPYPNQASPDVAAARGRVRALVGDLLPGGVDEGTGAALDPLIASWASGWLARIDSEHADHHAVVDRLIGGARRQLADAEAAHEHDRGALEIARRDYADARERLMEPPAAAAVEGRPEDAGRRSGPVGLLRRVAGRGSASPATPTAAPDPEPATGPIRMTPEEPATDQPLTGRTGEAR